MKCRNYNNMGEVQIISYKNAYKDFKQTTRIKLVVCSHVNVTT